MPEEKNVITLGVKDLKISKLLKDDSTGVKYDTPHDVPGVKTIEITITTEDKELTGDGVLLASSSKKKGYDVTFTNAQLNPQVMAIINGSKVTEGGELDNETITISDDADDKPNYFALEFIPEETDGAGEYHRTLYKVKGNAELQYTESDYSVYSFTGKGVARDYDKKFGKTDLYTNETPIAQIPEINAQST